MRPPTRASASPMRTIMRAEDVAVDSSVRRRPPGSRPCAGAADRTPRHTPGRRGAVSGSMISMPFRCKPSSAALRGSHCARPSRIGHGDLLVDQDLAGAQDLLVLRLRGRRCAWVGSAPCGSCMRITSCALPSRFSSSSRYSSRFDRTLRHAGLHGGLRHRGSFPDQHARVERLGDDVVRPNFRRSTP